MVWLRLEHDAFGEFTQLSEVLVDIANRLQISTICLVNEKADMYAMPGENPKAVFSRWQKASWKHPYAKIT